MPTGLVDSTGTSLNLVSSLIMPILQTAFSKTLVNISATFVLFQRNLPFSFNDI